MVAPHVQQDALALLETGQLHGFHAAFSYDPTVWWQKLGIRTGRWLGRDFERELRKRTVDPALRPYLTSDPARELVRLLAARIDRSQRLGDVVWERAEIGFDRRVARHRLAADVEAVFGYEHACADTFQAAKASGRKTLYVVPAPEPGFVQRMFEKETAEFPELQTAFFKHTSAREDRRAARREREWNLADRIFVASKFTRETYVQAGRDVGRVTLAPLGAPPPLAREACLAGGSRPEDPMTFLWAGTFGIRKGAHYLLQAWRAGNLGRHARLRIFGSATLPARVLRPLPDGVELLGSVPRDELWREYEHGDALVFPTLCDGFGMVATEAWSHGMPVITTDRAGVFDLLKPGQNGLQVTAGDAPSLLAALTWCLEHRAEVREMRAAARDTALRWQWSDYRRLVGAAVAELGEARRT